MGYTSGVSPTTSTESILTVAQICWRPFAPETIDRDYRLGHKFTWSGWFAWAGGELFEPGMRLSYRWQGDISGEDVSLSVPNPTFPYPAPVVDPTAFGGQQLDLAVYST